MGRARRRDPDVELLSTKDRRRRSSTGGRPFDDENEMLKRDD